MKKFLSFFLILSGFLAVKADDANWKIHPVFDEEVNHVIETPSYVYFTSRNLMANPSHDTYFSLFRYDKKGEELMGLSSTNILNDNSITQVVYNPSRGYVAVLYKDFNIDLLYNNGEVANIPYYKQSGLAYSKNVNSMTIDPANNRIYLATDFGYVAVNDDKKEIAESRIYGSPFQAFCRVGDEYLAIQEDRLLRGDAESHRLSINEYHTVGVYDKAYALYPVGNQVCIMLSGNQAAPTVHKITLKDGDLKVDEISKKGEIIHNIDYTTNGLVMTTDDALNLIKSDGSLTKLERHEEYGGTAAISENMSEVWNGFARKGLSSIKKTGQKWSLTRDWMLPDAPATYASNSFANHPDKGLLVLNFGYTPSTVKLYSFAPFQLSGLKQGRWTNYAPVYTNPERGEVLTATTGIAVDPDNSQYVYITSYHNGFMRLNLKDPQDVIHFSRLKDADAGNPGFAELIPNPTVNSGYSNISAPKFDKQGNLWMSFPNWDEQNNPKPNFYCWLAADRKASTPTDIKPVSHVVADVTVPLSNYTFVLPLLHTGNGLIVFSAGEAKGEAICMIDTNGTPVDMTDDKVYKFPSFTDSDGNTVDISRVRYMWEDPNTGYVWICHGGGVCYFVPSQVRAGNYQVNRVKVSRNDGTNLADYLLEGVAVNSLAADSEGRKWFATDGAGIACTTSDGREIIEVFNASNSPLPDDAVYAAGYDSASNSLMMSTAQGLAQYFLPVSQTSSHKEDIKAYPNPVRPEFSGFVTITDIPSGSFVKIVDSAGNLVKELGIVSGFDILWDLSDHRFVRVRSGVYYIMVSPSDESSSYSTVGKILVMS